MHPILFEWGPVTIYSYGVALAFAFLIATLLAKRRSDISTPGLIVIQGDELINFFSIALVGGIVGGRLFYIALHWPYFVKVPSEIPAIWHGGLVWYGAFFGGLLSGWLYVRSKGYSFIKVLDQIVPFVALGHGIGRVGCLLNGCCYGVSSAAWCGVYFPGQLNPVLPTQVFESLGLLTLFLILRRAQHLPLINYPGLILGFYLIGYAFLRFMLEHFRGDKSALWGGLTLQQLISFVMLVVGMWFLFRQQKKKTAS